MFYMLRKSSYFSSKFFKECLHYIKIHLIDLKILKAFFPRFKIGSNDLKINNFCAESLSYFAFLP